MIALLQIFGGVALLLFGVRYLRKALDRLFGARLGRWMRQLVDHPGRAFACGIGVATVAPSSTTISLMAVQAIQAGRITARQMLALMLGANIGLTIMVVLIAFRVEAYAPIVILIGVILFMYTERPKLRGSGQFLLAFGFIFLGIDVMRRAAETGLETGLGVEAIINFENLQSMPVLLAVFAAIFTMLMQSSTAAIALVIGLGAADAVSFRFAVPIVLGANVGMACTTLVVGWRVLESRRLAMANLLLKAAVAAVGLIVVALFGDKLPEPGGDFVGLGIVGVHTGFNIVVALIGMPILAPITGFVEALIPEPRGRQSRPFGPRYINNGVTGSVSLSLGQSLHEILHMSNIVRGMLTDAWKALDTGDRQLVDDVSRRDDHVDQLESAIKDFLTRLVKEEFDKQDADEQLRQLRYLSELETIGDIIDKNICQLVEKMIRLGVSFSEEGKKELDDFFQRVLENMTIAETAFTTRDPGLAQQLLHNKETLGRLETELRDRHFARLNAGLAETHETSAIHLDLLTHLKRINSALSHVAHAILRDRPPQRDETD